MSIKKPETSELITVEIPEDWETCELKNRPWCLTVKGYSCHFWDEYLSAWAIAADSQGAIEWDSNTCSLDIFKVKRGANANEKMLKKVLEDLKNGMPEMIIEFVCKNGIVISR